MYCFRLEKGRAAMKYSESEIRQYVAEEDVKFLRMTFLT